MHVCVLDGGLRQNGCTPLYFAAQNGHLEAVRILIEVKADINAKSTVCDPAYRPFVIECLHVPCVQSLRICVRLRGACMCVCVCGTGCTQECADVCV